MEVKDHVNEAGASYCCSFNDDDHVARDDDNDCDCLRLLQPFFEKLCSMDFDIESM